jgi:hypothetical protein
MIAEQAGVGWFALLFAFALLPRTIRPMFTRRPMETPIRRSRARAYVAGSLAALVLAAITLPLDLAGSRAGIRVALTVPDAGELFTWALLAGALGLGIWLLDLVARRLGATVNTHAVDLLPRTVGERWAAYAAALLSGTVEEYVMRGYFIALMTVAVGSAPIGVGLVSILFGLLHAPRDRAAAISGSLLGVTLAVPVLATGTLLPSVIARASVEIASVTWTLPILVRWKLAPRE